MNDDMIYCELNYWLQWIVVLINSVTCPDMPYLESGPTLSALTRRRVSIGLW